MPIKTNGAALGLILQMLDPLSPTKPRLKTTPQKPDFGGVIPTLFPLPRKKPEEMGVSSSLVADFIKELYEDKSLDSHSLMIVKDGAVIAEADFGAYDHRYWHITHSACKSITALAIGMLIDEGALSLDECVLDIFQKRIPKLSLAAITLKNLTVRHLLTMTSGIEFNEAGSVVEENWLECILNSPLWTEPGKDFNYNSMNTYLLSAILTEKTGESLSEYLTPRLFEPLGIEKVFWEKCPMGIEKGGWGLYIRLEDLVKIGLLLMEDGLWNGNRLISSQWIRSATTTQVETPEDMCAYDYGFQIWCGRGNSSFLFHGMFGQDILCFPDTGFIVAYNGGNDELFQGDSFFKTVTNYFGSGFLPLSHPLPENMAHENELSGIIKEIKGIPAFEPKKKRSFMGKLMGTKRLKARASNKALPNECKIIDKRVYSVEKGRFASVGVMPLIAQAIQNNYTEGISEISFSQRDNGFSVCITEGGSFLVLPVGFSEPKYADLCFNGEIHHVGITGKFTTDEEERLVLKLRLSFLEISSARLIKFFFAGDELIIEWSERPGTPLSRTVVETLKATVMQNPLAAPVVTNIIKDRGYLEYLVYHAIEPVTTAKLKTK